MCKRTTKKLFEISAYVKLVGIKWPQRAYYTSPWQQRSMKHRWNDLGKGPEKNLPQCLFIHPNSVQMTLDCFWAPKVEKQQLILCKLQHSQNHNLKVHVNFIHYKFLHIMLTWKNFQVTNYMHKTKSISGGRHLQQD